MRLALLVLVTVILARQSNATDLTYTDFSTESPNGEWRLDANLPDNQDRRYRPWQDNFVYSMHKGDKQIWERKQRDQYPQEAPPSYIVVADDGWTAIHTGRDQLFFIDPGGRIRGRIDDLKKRLPENDLREFAARSSVGLIWSPSSLWHFANVDGQLLFVIRLWWAHQLVFDPDNGEQVQLTPPAAKAIHEWQVEHCRNILAESAVRGVNDDSADGLSTAVLLAGQLKIRDTIPHLRQLERSEYVGISGGVVATDLAWGEINPFMVRHFTIRQSAQLSLRRLGESPTPSTVFEFSEGRTHKDFRPEPRQNRDRRIASIKAGMSAREVLDLLGSPDFISFPEWSYDLDGEEPKTAVISWDSRKVKDVKLTKPMWLDGLSRDRAVVGF